MTDAEIYAIADRLGTRFRNADEEGVSFDKHAVLDFARAVLGGPSVVCRECGEVHGDKFDPRRSASMADPIRVALPDDAPAWTDSDAAWAVYWRGRAERAEAAVGGSTRCQAKVAAAGMAVPDGGRDELQAR